MNTPTHDAIIKAMQSFLPIHLSLDNESHKHAGYFEGKESHFKLAIVSQAFADKRLVSRHQMVYAAVSPLMMANGGSIHALAIHAYTPDEWAVLGQAPNSPNCAGQHTH